LVGRPAPDLRLRDLAGRDVAQKSSRTTLPPRVAQPNDRERTVVFCEPNCQNEKLNQAIRAVGGW
jgi:hypothetical protein